MKGHCNKSLKILFSCGIDDLHDDSFEGSVDEHRLFREVFFGHGTGSSSKRCLVTGAINFENDNNKHKNVSFCSNSDNSVMTSQEDLQNAVDDSGPGCLSEECTLLTRNDPDVEVKRIKLSVEELSNAKPYLEKVVNSSSPSKVGVSCLRQPASIVTYRLVESSGQGVTSSCYLLKGHVVDMADRNVSNSKCEISSFDGSDQKAIVVSKAIASPVSQESHASKLLVSNTESLQCSKKRWKDSCFVELDKDEMSVPKDSASDSRPLLRYHIHRLLRAAGWVIGRRKRSTRYKGLGEYVYKSPEGRPIREFHRAWNLCGQKLFADAKNVVHGCDGKQWTDLTQFRTDLSGTLTKIEEQLNILEAATALARWWHLLDPFANVVFIDKTLGLLKEGILVKAYVKHDALKNVITVANQIAGKLVTISDQPCGSPLVSDSALTVFEEDYCIRKEQCDGDSFPNLRQFQGKAVTASKHVSSSLYECKCNSSLKETSRLNPRSLPACRSDSTSCQTCNCLSESVSPRQDSSTSSLRLVKRRSGHSEGMPLKVLKDAVKASSYSDGRTMERTVTCKVNNLLQGSVNDHSNNKNDGFGDSHGSGRNYMESKGSSFELHRLSLVEDSHLLYLNDTELQSGYIDKEGGQSIEGQQFRIDDASFQPDAFLKRKAHKKSKRISEIKLTTLYRSEELGLSASYKGQLHEISKSSIQLESDVAKDRFEDNIESDKNCKKWSLCSSEQLKEDKQSRFKKCKKPMICQLKDDDLLLSAIIKNRSTTKRSSVKRNSRVSSALRKYKSQKGSCRLLPRSLSKGGQNHMEGKWSDLGGRTVLSWLVNTGVIFLKEVIQYRNPEDDAVVKDGVVTQDGILCRCCDKVLSVSEFKSHSGFLLNRPCLNLFMESGKSFTLCQLEAWSAEYKVRKGATRTIQVEEMDENDDSCGLCGDGGELICCDNCPSTFHQTCLYAQELPEGNWYCSKCSCWICGDVVKDKETSIPGALKCMQCEHKYHEECIKEKGMERGVVPDTWFCGESCQEVYSGLHSRIGLMNSISDGFSWTLLRCIHGDKKVHSAQRLVAQKAECNLKLAVALTIMEECFLPMVDPRTGIDMIPHVLYNWGSEFVRLNYEGFFTVVLEKDDVLLSVASIRIHGVTVAEMPLIATCSRFRRQGMCRRLMNAIEEMLKSYKVEKLVVSAIPSLVDTWTEGFGFTPLEDHEKQSLTKTNLMVFPGTVWLKKPLYLNSRTETLDSSEQGPTIEPSQQYNTQSELEEATFSDCRDLQVGEEDQDGNLVKDFSKLSCEEPPTTKGSSPTMVCNVKSLEMYNNRELPLNDEQLEKTDVIQRNE